MLKETSTKAKVQEKNNEFQSTGVEKTKIPKAQLLPTQDCIRKYYHHIPSSK